MTRPLSPLALLSLAASLALAALPARAQVWRSLGPSGGDVRSLAMDPRIPRDIYLGTTDGHVFGSRDAGGHWQLLGRAGDSREAVVTSLIVSPRDSRTLYAGTWTREQRSEGGGVFVSEDGGAHWASLGLAGHAVRALALAPSDPNELVAGALDGIFLSADSGRDWQRISPAGDPELHNVDSVAIDPRDANVIFAGTFHLPWKTLDAGRHWMPIHTGMVDDSDVFSLAVDATLPSRIFATACTGIYRSDDGGGHWTHLHSLPNSARRTHMLMQDPLYPKVVYAGTTEGLWKTTDTGLHWQIRTPPNWVINAVLVLPDSGRVVLGTDQIGILVSDDGARYFRVSNSGFDHRQVVTMAVDARNPSRAICVLANAPETTLVTNDGGRSWFPTGPGLNAEQVRRVYSAPSGWIAALETGGLVRYDEVRHEWVREDWGAMRGKGSVRRLNGEKIPVVNDMDFTASGWLAATSSGLFISHDSSADWESMTSPTRGAAVDSVLKMGRQLWVVSSGRIWRSTNAGRAWKWQKLPGGSGRALRISSVKGAWLASAERGLYISRDSGRTWALSAHGLPASPPSAIVAAGQAWIAALPSGGLYLSKDQGESWGRMSDTVAEGVFPFLKGSSAGGRIFAASTTEGFYSLELGAPPAPVQSAAIARR